MDDSTGALTRRLRCWGALIGATTALAGAAHAQNPNQYGAQDRADAAHDLVVLAVQRAISSLPPTAGQSVVYEFDPKFDAFQRSTRLGPTVLRSTPTIGQGMLAVRVSASYFELDETFGPMDYHFTLDEPLPDGTKEAVAKLGLGARARVGVTTLSASYGLLNRLDLTASVPITIVDANATQTFSTEPSTLSEPADEATLGVVGWDGGGNLAGGRFQLNEDLRSGSLVMRRERFSAMGFDFDGGTQVGLGRVSLGAKGALLAKRRLHIAGMGELFLPSPNSAEFAGPNSFAVLPRVIAMGVLTDAIHAHADLGYQYDFDHSSLRCLTWNTGGSWATHRLAVDLGFGGSVFDTPIHWTPTRVRQGPTTTFPRFTMEALGDTETGSNFVDLLLGLKLRVAEGTVIAGAVTVPIDREKFQPAALGTIAVEQYF